MPVLWLMRALLATGIAVSLAALAGGAQAREVSFYRGKCGEMALPAGPTALASAVRIETRCGSFSVGRKGVRFVAAPRRRQMIEGLLWERGRLAFYRRGRLLWRSPRWDGDHLVGWTSAGLLLTWEAATLSARTRSGRVVSNFATARNPLHRFDPETRTLLFVSPRYELLRTDGRRTEVLASLDELRVGRVVEIAPVADGRIVLVGRRVVVLSSRGSVVASDRRRGIQPVFASRDAVAMISTGPLDARSRAKESVRLLRPGERSSTLLFTTEVGALGCGHWPTLAWRDDELLYSTSEGHVVVLQPSAGERLDLTAVVKRLPGEFLGARWA
jgi:hypothetical protein